VVGVKEGDFMSKAASLGFSEIADIEIRRTKRRSLSATEWHAIAHATSEWQWYYSVYETVVSEEVWYGELADGTYLDLKSNGTWVAPFWPHEELGKHFISTLSRAATVEPMPIDHWIDTVLDQECRADSCLISFCPLGNDVTLKSVDELLSDLSRCRSNPGEYCRKHFDDDIYKLVGAMKAKPRGLLP
jgi:Protein of unknown function (DUF2750)